jgi:uncharacterized protein (DUF58 family)
VTKDKRPYWFIADLLLTMRWYTAMGACSGLFVLAFFFPFLFTPAAFITLGVLGLTLVDYAQLFMGSGRISAKRTMPPRFSLGDENAVHINLQNGYAFQASILLIEELPIQFQERDWRKRFTISSRARREISYPLRPTTRGEYEFGNVLVYVSSPLGLVRRRFTTGESSIVKVYPSFLRMRKYQLMAVTDNAVVGAKKVRRLGHSMEFEKIKSYVQGDDIRSINWKASARSGDLMVNMYTDTRQQQIYCFLDKGRAMKMPFDGLTLLDHSINAALALMNVALMRQDKAGLITFSQKINDVVAADRRSGQLNILLEALYRQETDYKESDYEALWAGTHRRLSQRSFILLFTNFETMSSLERQLTYLRHMSRQHLLCVVFFQNTLLKDLQESQPDTVEGIYVKTIADRFDFEKRQIVKELRRHGILSILTTPQSLSADVINRYLELKARQMI